MAPYLDYRPLREAEQSLVAALLQESWLAQNWDAVVLQHAMTTLVPQHLEEVKAGKQVSRLEKRLAQLQAEAQITAKVPNLKGGALVISPEAVDAQARKRVKLLAMNAVFEAEKALGRMPKDVSAQRGLFFIEVKGRADGADSVTLTINEVNTGRNAPHRFRLALVSGGTRSGRATGVHERRRLGSARFRRYPDHQKPAAVAGRREGIALTNQSNQGLGSRMHAHLSHLGGVDLDLLDRGELFVSGDWGVELETFEADQEREHQQEAEI